MLKLRLACDADAAWRAAHSPQALAELYGPWMTLAPEVSGEVPASWESGGEAVVALRLCGILPIGRQQIHVSDLSRTDPADGSRVRILRDSGIPLTGPLADLEVWDHRIAVSADPVDPSRTLWRERLVFGGRTAVLVWPLLWLTWQWRGLRARRLAPGWAR